MLGALVVVLIVTEAHIIPVVGIRPGVEIHGQAVVGEDIEIALQRVTRTDETGNAADGLRTVTLFDVIEFAGHAAVFAREEHAELMVRAELRAAGQREIDNVIIMVGQTTVQDRALEDPMIRIEGALADQIHRAADALGNHVRRLGFVDLDLGNLAGGNDIEIDPPVAAVVGQHRLAVRCHGVVFGRDPAHVDIAAFPRVAFERDADHALQGFRRVGIRKPADAVSADDIYEGVGGLLLIQRFGLSLAQALDDEFLHRYHPVLFIHDQVERQVPARGHLHRLMQWRRAEIGDQQRLGPGRHSGQENVALQIGHRLDGAALDLHQSATEEFAVGGIDDPRTYPRARDGSLGREKGDRHQQAADQAK